jgi:xanthine dehydrogenase molybdopterin-binding subunit B
MEPHATLARWAGNRLELEDSTQYVAGVRRTMAKTFGIPPADVRVRSAFVGGAFGGKGSAWSHVALAAMAARMTGRPVRLVMQRPQLFGPVGGRPTTAQAVRLGCDAEGRLTALEHRSTSSTSTIEDWLETCAIVTRMLYACPNLATAHRLAKLNVGTPTFQRAPGESTGMFALESAIDELATPPASTRSSCGCATTRASTRTGACPSRASRSPSASGSARSASAGRAAARCRARCATATGWWASAARAPPVPPSACPAPLACG